MSVVTSRAPLFGLETPHPLQPTQNYFQLIGWAFVPGSERQNSVRIVIEDRIFQPTDRFPRPDVAHTFSGEPAALQSGFKFICYLPFGFYTGRLEISADDNAWQTVSPLAIPVSSHPILGAIQTPETGPLITQPVRIEGWCFHPEFTVREIVLQFGNVEVACDYGLPRPDVSARFPDHSAAGKSGFITTENLPRGTGTVKIRATTTCGRIYFVRSELTVNVEAGWIPKPPPPSPVRDLSTLPDARDRSPRLRGTPGAVGNRNILFALYGDFSSNSALHVASLANELIALGYDCVVAVPENKETVGALPEAQFMAVEFEEVHDLATSFKDGLGPCIIHAWTSRENVRKFCAQITDIYHCAVFVHLEDNEHDIIETRLRLPIAELIALPDAELDALIPDVLSHPKRAKDFLSNAVGVTLIVEQLKDQVPSDRPTSVIWPAADRSSFVPLRRDDRLRAALGIKASDIVLFYHGNTHSSNASEVRSLYEAVVLLNQRGLSAQLIRTGRDFPDFLAGGDDWIRPYLIHLGHIGRAKRLPALMALADFFVQPGVPDAFNNYRFPSKLPEFFAIGRPVILPQTNLGNIVRHGIDAWVLPLADASSIADAIAKLHADPDLSEKLSRGAVAFAAEHFSWPRSARKLLEFYRSLTPLGAPASS